MTNMDIFRNMLVRVGDFDSFWGTSAFSRGLSQVAEWVRMRAFKRYTITGMWLTYMASQNVNHSKTLKAEDDMVRPDLHLNSLDI